MYFKINTPQVTHETIDGEAVIVNLYTGNYYSMNGVGATVWQLIDLGASKNEIIEIINQNYKGDLSKIENCISYLIEQMKDEGLISLQKKFNSKEKIDFKTPSITNGKDKPVFESPSLNKYTDMQDLLLLDPIHEVDDSGWPVSNSN